MLRPNNPEITKILKGIIIQGSSRKDGNTARVTQPIAEALNWEVWHLCDYGIAHYHYDHAYSNDDFMPLIRQIADDYEVILFATPVYWYAMSGLTKVFLDRISDCLKIEKATGRKLRGKFMASLSCGSEAHLNEGFHVPFELTAEYLGMTYLGNAHTWIEEDEIEEAVLQRISDFVERLKST